MSGYEAVKAWRKLNPEKVREQTRRYRARHPETAKRASEKYRATHGERLRAVEAERARKRRKANPEAQRRRMAAYKARYRAWQEQLMGRPRPAQCELCGEDGYGRGNKPEAGICFDHDHASGKARGWLCDRCNKVLGLVRDSADLLRKLTAYLEFHHMGKHHDGNDGKSLHERGHHESHRKHSDRHDMTHEEFHNLNPGDKHDHMIGRDGKAGKVGYKGC